MFKAQPLSPKDFFLPHFYKTPIGEAEFIAFTKHLQNYAQKLESNLNQNEDFLVANALAPLFQNIGFNAEAKYKQKGKSEIDLVLKKDNQVAVIIECKKHDSKDNFSGGNPTAKALLEAILYYLRERENANTSIQAIIITDFYGFYVFSARDFEEVFYKTLAKFYANFSAPNSLFKGNTEEFYTQAKKILDSSELHINYLYLNVREALNADFSFWEIKPIFKALSTDFLLGEFNPNDANVLNERFYRELLYILGLSEVKQSGKILIKPDSSVHSSTQGNLYNAIMDKLPKDLRDFDSAMNFLVLWLNRVLFLKLIEANLTRFNQASYEKNKGENLKFLNLAKIPNFKALSSLFFEVLAKEPHRRNTNSPLSFLPYLNSSLFERHKCEEVLDIAELSDSAELEYFHKTQIKDEHSKQKSGKIALLAYIFEFLDSFDFGSDEESEIINQKELISSSVLGLVFEKLNGYKEGSFYTPNFITSYMCKQSLQKVVLQRFNEEYEWECENLKALRIQVDRHFNAKKESFLETLRGIKICDPAVGSGHFLVSVLNEMIGIYDALGLIERIPSGNVAIENDEIIVRERGGKIFAYAKPSVDSENHKIQKTLFALKKSIIESNLYGVDINPNSVEICKLRLWIELLKNSYYLLSGDEGYLQNLDSTIHQMQTLPNIDINIKCGNSLISRFSLQDSLRHIPNINKQINEYQQLVFDYKNSDKSELRASKKDIEAKIQNLKAIFRLTLKDPKTKQALEKAIQNHIRDFGNFLLDDESLLDGLSGAMGNLFGGAKLSEEEEQKAAQSYAHIKLLRHKLDSALSGAEYKGAFEWRFEFPEVLGENGDFLGFDLIIGNPPYGNLNKDFQKHIIESAFPHSYFGEISSNFAELAHTLIKPRGHFSFVTSYALTFSLAQSGLRNLLRSHYKNIQISSYDRDGFPQFDKMSQSVSILFADSKGDKQKADFKTSNFVRQKITHEELEFSPVNDLLLIDSEIGSDFAKKHRIPKIGGAKNLEMLRHCKRLPNTLGNLFGGKQTLYIRTSGNYWYNAFLEIPYKSTEIKQFSVSDTYFAFCLINSSVYYWWLRIYGDGRHNNKDIMDSFRLPKVELIRKYNDLWEKLSLSHWAKMQAVFNAQNNFFATSQIKEAIDILDYHICLKVLGLDMATLKYICEYDSNIRGGLKADFNKLEKRK